MKTESSTSLRCASALLLALTASCGEAPDISTSSAALQSARAEAWEPSLATNVSSVEWGDAVEVRGCTYTIGRAIEMQPYPPRYPAIVRRSGDPEHCALGYVIIARSWAWPSIAIASGHGALVADSSMKVTPSGSAHVRLVIVEISPATGDVLQDTELAAWSPTAPQLGNVYDGALHLGPGGDLTVTGDKNGIIPGEIGAGERYTAVYGGFLGPKSSSAPTSVIAF